MVVATKTKHGKKASARSRKKKKKETKISYYQKPDKLSLQEWQIALRKQFAKTQAFSIKNLGQHPVWSDFRVTNHSTGNTYKVAIRSRDIGKNFCSCMDFKTNMLGTCKHIEYLLGHFESKRNLKSQLKKDYQPEYTSMYLKYGNKREVMIRVGTEQMVEFSVLTAKYFDENLRLKDECYDIFDQLLDEAVRINPNFRCYDDALEYIVKVRDDHRRLKLIDTKFSNGNTSTYFSSLVKAKLFPYQVEGVLLAAKAGRCLIADDMGLGKTLQAITAAELMKKEFRISSVLIVCPTSLKYQWKSEIDKFTQSSTLVIEGNRLNRKNQYEQDEFYKIASYNVISNDAGFINDYNFDLVILDEAQRVKNWNTKLARNVKKLQTPYAFVLTGTPIENKLEDLYSIMSFVDSYRLGPVHDYLYQHQVKDEVGKVVGYKDLNKLGEILSGVMVRRTKKEVLLQLPERSVKNLLVPITEEQSALHEEYYETVCKIVTKWRRFGYLNENDRQRLLIALNSMRMVCDSTFILDQKTRHDTKIDELMNLLEEVFGMEDEKIVVFSQWERMTRLVAQELDEQGIGYQYLHGGVPSVQRKDLYDNFNNDPSCRVFLSTDAGGVGLNLQSASMMVNLDIPWNPAVLEQRIARVHRMGQKKKVSVVNLVSIGTIEHRMLDVLKFKSGLARGILDNGEDSIFMGESKFKEFMKTVEQISEPTGEKFSFLSTEKTWEEEEKGKHESSSGEKVKPKEVQLSFFGDDDIPASKTPVTEKVEMEQSANELITSGIQFFSKLTKTLTDKDATEKLISSLVENDSETGKRYLRIPVENEKVVENALKFLSGFLSGMGK